MGFQPFHPCAAGLLTRLLDLYWPCFINRKLQCTGTKGIFQGLQQVYHRAGNQTPASFSVIFVFPFLSCIPACSVSPCSLVLGNSKFPEPSLLARALPWSSSDKVRSEFSLFKNSVQLPDRKTWWAESQSDVGKEGEKVSGCCVLGGAFVPKSVGLLCLGSTHVAGHMCVLVGELSWVIRINLLCFWEAGTETWCNSDVYNFVWWDSNLLCCFSHQCNS